MDRALPLAVGVGVPIAPAYIGETAEVGAERTPGLPLIGRDAFFGFSDLARQLIDRLLRVADLVVAARKTRDLKLLQRRAVLLELCPVPGDLAVAVSHTQFS